jgi:hypothetical protein
MRLHKLLVLTTIVPLTNAALAQGGGGPVRAACQSDVHALCGAVQPGGGRIRDCMRQHRAELSAACKIAIADRMLERGGQPANAGTPAAGATSAPRK